MSTTWKDIGTAPKDGTHILVGCYEPRCRWNPETKVHDKLPPTWQSTVVYWTDYPRSINEWCLVEAGSHAEDETLNFEATHWTEIPTPPPHEQ